VIEKHIDNTGQCPITGGDLEKKDLIPLKVEKVTKPKPLSQSGIPGMIGNMQNEWDSVVLETFELRKHLGDVKKHLSHALYQHDAATRVISRLIQERDEARQALALTQEKLKDFEERLGVKQNQPQGEKVKKLQEETKEIFQETENCGVYPELNNKINKVSEGLFNMRKTLKKPEGYLKSSDFSILTEKGKFPFHSTTNPGASSIDIHPKLPNLICSGGNDGTTVIFDKNSGKVTHSFGDKNNVDVISGVQFTENGVLVSKQNGRAEYWVVDLVSKSAELKSSIKGHPGIVASNHPLNPYVVHGVDSNSWGFYNMETGVKLFQTSEEGLGLTSIRVHPDGLIVATGLSSGVVKLWDLRTQACVGALEGIKTPVTSLEFSEKAIHLAGSSNKSNIAGLWNLKKFQKPPQSIIHQQGTSIRNVSFDPYGAYIVTASDKTLCFYETSNTENCLFELPAHDSNINGVKFAPNASYIATASADRFVKLFQW